MHDEQYAAIFAEVRAELDRDPDEAREQWGPWLELLGLDLEEAGGHPGTEKLRADYIQFAAVAIWCARELDGAATRPAAGAADSVPRQRR